MSVNRNKPHLYILPEDDHNRELANGFITNPSVVNIRQTQVLAVAGGWLRTLEKFRDEYVPRLKQFQLGNIVLLIDFDGECEVRRSKFTEAIPDQLKDRVFVIGVLDEPQDLKNTFRLAMTFEEIGSALAEDCRSNKTEMWDHEHLKHNDPERIRMMQAVRSILFSK